MKLYLIRHGESINNISRRWTGWHDAPLTEKGESDALRTGRFLKGIPFDKVYSSDLIRAIRTQQLALPELEGERTPLVREINVGSLTDMPMDEGEERFGEILKEVRRTGNFSLVGGESAEEFHARLRKFLEMVEQQPCERVAVFCHGGVISGMLDLVYGITLPRGKAFSLNGAITVLENQAGVWRLRLFNYTGELE